jgi:hypothetical protein
MQVSSSLSGFKVAMLMVGGSVLMYSLKSVQRYDY